MIIKSSRLLDDGNYVYWKIHKTTHIKSLGMDVWKSIVTRLTNLTKVENGKIVIKPEPEWNWEERKTASRNFTALHAIQCGMDNRMFEVIASTRSAKEAWDTLQYIFEKS